MMPEDKSPFRLTGQRIFIIALVLVALALAAGSIISSMRNWSDQDAAATEAR